ncbi:hypothetical protein RZS08_45200, partial [Arthrospira platensis SPKY1]|nr:hypothetical protein [Arthrospira platensis SPKY1]
THTTSPLIPGTTETFTFSVRNNGPTYAYGATVVLNLLDTEWSIDNNSSSPGWSFFGTGTFVKMDEMAPGEVANFTVDLAIPANAIIVAPDAIGPFTVIASASNPDPNIGNNTFLGTVVSENHAD